MLQAVSLVCEEGEEIAPVSLRIGVDVGVMRELHGPAEAPYTTQALWRDHDAQEAEGDLVLPKLERVGAVEGVDCLGVNLAAGDEEWQEAGCLVVLDGRGG